MCLDPAAPLRRERDLHEPVGHHLGTVADNECLLFLAAPCRLRPCLLSAVRPRTHRGLRRNGIIGLLRVANDGVSDVGRAKQLDGKVTQSRHGVEANDGRSVRDGFLNLAPHGIGVPPQCAPGAELHRALGRSQREKRGTGFGADESACRPGSVAGFRRPAAIHLGPPLPAASSGLPARLGRAALERRARDAPRGASLLDLAPGGVYRAAHVTVGAGGLLHHPFTLTPAKGAVCFLWHCPAGRPGSALPTTSPCGARTFLGGIRAEHETPTRPPGRLVRRASKPNGLPSTVQLGGKGQRPSHTRSLTARGPPGARPAGQGPEAGLYATDDGEGHHDR